MNIRIFFSRLLSLGGLFIGINILYYVYQLVLNHGLSVSLYGGMSSLLAWTVLASIPSIALSTFLTRYVTLYHTDREKQASFVHGVFFSVLKMIAYLSPIVIIMGFWIAPYMSLSWLGYIALVFTVIAIIFVGFFRSIAYVDGRLALYTWSTFFEVGSRIVFTLIALYFTSTLEVLYALYFLSIFLTLGFFVGDIRRIFSRTGGWHFTPSEAREMKKSVIPMIFLSCFLISIGSTELVLARRILSSEDLGYFSALIMTAKLVIAGLGIWTAVGIPYFSDATKHRGTLFGVYGGFAITAIIACVVFFFGGGLFVDILFPDGYEMIVPYVVPIALYAIVVSLMGLVIQHAVIAGKKTAGYLSIVIPIVLVIVFSFADSMLASIVWATLIGYTAGAVVWALGFVGISLKNRYVKKEGTSCE